VVTSYRVPRPRAGALTCKPAGWRWPPTARVRILAWSVLLLAVALAASTAATYVLLMQRASHRVTDELAHEAGEFRAALAARDNLDGSEGPGSVLAVLRLAAGRAVPEPNVTFLGLIDGHVAVTSAATPLAPLAADGNLVTRWARSTAPASGSASSTAGPVRYIALPLRLPGDAAHGIFVAAVFTAPEHAAITRIVRLQLEADAAALLLASLVGWLASGRVLRPIRQTTDLARRITETDLAERIPVHGHDEISELAVTINRMLDRLEAAFTAQRAFLADAGHELRTPITIVQGNLDTLTVRNADDAETLSVVTDELQRMARLVDELLLLARSGNPDFLHPQPTDVADLTYSLLAKAESLDGRPWSIRATALGSCELDRQRITQAIIQLAANAAKHTPASTPVELSSSWDGDALLLSVADRGPGIPAGEHARIFDRFARLDTRRPDSTGLGLSIVAAIAAAHGGHADVHDRPGGGAIFHLHIPREGRRGNGNQHQETEVPHEPDPHRRGRAAHRPLPRPRPGVRRPHDRQHR
jgi:two-component system, OmpR family, sensor kinase